MFALASDTSFDSSDTDSADSSSTTENPGVKATMDTGGILTEESKQGSKLEQQGVEEDLMGPAKAEFQDDEEELLQDDSHPVGGVTDSSERRKRELVQEDEGPDDFSDVSDNSDIYHVAVYEEQDYVTIGRNGPVRALHGGSA